MSGIVNSLFNASAITATGASAIKKGKNEIKSVGNKYDNILGNKVQKAPLAGGAFNAVNINPMFRSASEIISELYKQAAENDPKQDTGFQNRDRSRRFSYDQKQLNRDPDEFPGSNVHEVELNPHKYKINPYLLMGATMLGAAGLDLLSAKKMSAPIHSFKEGFVASRYKIPKKILGKNKFVQNNLKELKKIDQKLTKKEQKILKQQLQQQYQNGVAARAQETANVVAQQLATGNNFNTGGNLKKQASVDKLKTLFRDDFVRAGVESVPYYAAPAVVSCAIGKNLSHPEDDPGVKRVIVEIPGSARKKMPTKQKKIKKIASADIDNALDGVTNNMTWKEWAKDTLPRRAVQGLGRTVIPAAVIGLTGRNIRGRMERLEKKKDQPQNVGDTRIIIETKVDPKEQKAFSKNASVADDANVILSNSIPYKKKKKKMRVGSDEIKQGIKKQFRMDTMH